jgi:hypothetical protein
VIPQKKIEIWTIQAEWISASLALTVNMLFGQAASVVAALLQERALLVLLRTGTVVVCLVTSELCIVLTTFWYRKCPAQALFVSAIRPQTSQKDLVSVFKTGVGGLEPNACLDRSRQIKPFMSRPVFVCEGLMAAWGLGHKPHRPRGSGCRSRMIALGGCWLPIVLGRRRKWKVKLNARHTAELFMQEHAPAGAEYLPS